MPEILSASAPTLTLEIHYSGVATRHEFRQPSVTIRRRNSEAPGDLAIEDRAVSRKHVLIEWRGRNYWLTDEGSLTGILCNGMRIPPGEWWPLTNGTRLAFGETQATVHLIRPDGASEFDVFICHSNAEKPRVRNLVADLRKHSINSWMDENAVAPAASWLPQLSSIMEGIGNAIIVWGPNGLGSWQKMEIDCLQLMAMHSQIRLIPVILEGTVKDPDWSVFLDAIHRIDFRKTTPDPLRELVELLRTPRTAGRQSPADSPPK